MIEKKVFDQDHETNCDIMFLVERDDKIRLMSFKTNPWLQKDWKKTKESDQRIVKESIYLFSGVMARPQRESAIGPIKEVEKKPAGLRNLM